jgi:hypothetical protein
VRGRAARLVYKAFPLWTLCGRAVKFVKCSIGVMTASKIAGSRR